MQDNLRSETVEEQRTGAKRRGEDKQGGEGQERQGKPGGDKAGKSGMDKIEKRAEAHIALTIVGGRKKT